MVKRVEKMSGIFSPLISAFEFQLKSHLCQDTVQDTLVLALYNELKHH